MSPACGAGAGSYPGSPNGNGSLPIQREARHSGPLLVCHAMREMTENGFAIVNTQFARQFTGWCAVRRLFIYVPESCTFKAAPAFDECAAIVNSCDGFAPGFSGQPPGRNGHASNSAASDAEPEPAGEHGPGDMVRRRAYGPGDMVAPVKEHSNGPDTRIARIRGGRRRWQQRPKRPQAGTGFASSTTVRKGTVRKGDEKRQSSLPRQLTRGRAIPAGQSKDGIRPEIRVAP